MRILIVSDEAWNDYIFGNGILTNWFTGFDAEFAQIYCSPELPDNEICDCYYRITDSEMLCSLLGGPKSGDVVFKTKKEGPRMISQHQGMYKKLKALSKYIHTPMMMIRDFIWMCGRYDKQKLSRFIEAFNPDIIFCPRLATPKLMRLERLIHSMNQAPMVAFTADDEASYQQYSWSPLYWMRRWYIHRMLGNTMSIYKRYFMFSEQQAKDYRNKYGIPTETLFKCTDKQADDHRKKNNAPIVIVYAGRLYCNRWKTLSAIGGALKEINKEEERIVLHIYTTDNPSKKHRKTLSPEKHIYFKGNVTPMQLNEIYRQADIALHVESFDKVNRLATRVSFSTKIIDLLASGCAVMAICWREHAGYQYLAAEQAAFCIDDYSKIQPCLQDIVDNPFLLHEYGKKAFQCAMRNHSRKHIHTLIRNRFSALIRHSRI